MVRQGLAMDKFTEFLHKPVVLMEGAIIERLRRSGDAALDPYVLNAGLVFGDRGREAMASIYRSYLDVGRDHGLPMIVLSPTWRANSERLKAAGLPGVVETNSAGIRFLEDIRAGYGPYAEKVLIGGLMACRGDAYDPADAMGTIDAERFHREHAQALADAGSDFIMAATLPAFSEALGIARALAATGTPYVISFVVRRDGTLLDGTPLSPAIESIDGQTDPPPAGYMLNCVHPAVFASAFKTLYGHAGGRMLGLQANTSELSPEELDGRESLDAEAPAGFAEKMVGLHRSLGIKLLGGCCGSDDSHIRKIAELLAR